MLSAMLKLVNIGKNFPSQTGETTALKNLNLEVHEGEFFSLLGPSGCGKSTLLRIIAGLEQADEGDILFRGQRINSWSAQKRPFNMVFQRYALFPHLTVAENVAFGLKIQKRPHSEIQDRVRRVLDQVGLKGFESRLPETLSGGQQQRVAVARALVNEPQILLLDEPLSALDQKMREHMQQELRSLQKKLGLTFIYITHDQEEALTLSDRIGILHEGDLEQVSTPREIYEQPASIFAAQFIGTTNCWPAAIIDKEQDRNWVIQTEAGARLQARFSQANDDLAPKESVRVCVRPEKIQLLRTMSSASAGTPDWNVLKARCTHSIFKGDQTELWANADGIGEVKLFLPEEEPEVEVIPGQEIVLGFPVKDTFVFGDRA